MSDRLLGGVLLVMALAYVVGASFIQSNMIFDPLGPQTFPMVCGGLVAVSCLYPLVRPDPEPDWPAIGRAVEIGAAVGGLIAYGYLLPRLGFIVATAVAAGALSWRLGGRARYTPVTGIGIGVGIYAVFHWFLGLALPHGTWTEGFLDRLGLMQPLNDAVSWTGSVISGAFSWLLGASSEGGSGT